MLWPHNGDDLRAGAQKVIDAGIPLVVFDRLIADIEPISEVDMDNVEYGASSARFLNEFFKDRLDAGEKIQVLEFRGDMSTASTMRSDGFNAAKHENIEIVQSFSTDWQRAKGMDYMQSFLIDNPQDLVESIDAIFTHDGSPRWASVTRCGTTGRAREHQGLAAWADLTISPSPRICWSSSTSSSCGVCAPSDRLGVAVTMWSMARNCPSRSKSAT